VKKSVHVLTVFVYVLSLVLANAGAALAEDSKASTKISHKPLKYFVPGHRITVNAEVTDQTGVTVVRAYFRASEQADYVFVSMNPAADGTYQGILPAPAKETQNITYLFLAVNGKNQVVKTQTFTVNREDKEKVPAWQQAGSEGNIQVSTELAQAPESISGFTDSIAMDVVESSARFGFVAGGIYTAAQMASAGGTDGAAAAAGSAGTVSASAGLSTAAIAGIGAGVAAVAGGIAAAGSSGGGGGTTQITQPTQPAQATLERRSDGTLFNNSDSEITVNSMEFIFTNYFIKLDAEARNWAISKLNEMASAAPGLTIRDDGNDFRMLFSSSFVIPLKTASDIFKSYQDIATEINQNSGSLSLLINVNTDAGSFTFS